MMVLAVVMLLLVMYLNRASQQLSEVDDSVFDATAEILSFEDDPSAPETVWQLEQQLRGDKSHSRHELRADHAGDDDASAQTRPSFNLAGLKTTGDFLSKAFTKDDETIDDLICNGWQRDLAAETERQDWSFDDWPPLSNLIRSFASTFKDDNEMVVWTYQENSAEQYGFPMEATYTNIINPRDGFLIVLDTVNPPEGINDPTSNLRQQHPNTEPTRLQLWEDVVPIAYKTEAETAGASPKGLTTIITLITPDVAGPDYALKRAIISACLDREAYDRDGDVVAPVWRERRRFPADSDELKILLASAAGHQIVWMLLRHRATLGQKEIVAVNVFALTEFKTPSDFWNPVNAEDPGNERVRYLGPGLVWEVRDV
ncbi:hypothetical protein KC318_g8504 [Hortaea werneckii]|nr:hypothetical protein KC334_g9318 [Hortaea werneckii]KAI7020459.1 hypothetical protein KC355_g2729 [Hortaea werneckii]KAI7157679.1 hypothetical protein KC324_g13856 [Hortaea werneckii]KAI7555196.1 hypothetical protein KC316_g13854 [Hortaea werneckii]KAI7663094.1 hypothetical protein KC318_g8504 [Hortaea werneckii]